MIINKQQKVADVLRQLKDAYAVGILNDYELAGKVLDAIRFDGLPPFDPANPDAHDCTLDEWYSGRCDHPSHHYELLEQQERPQSESEAHHLAH